MSEVEQIENRIKNLSPEELAKFPGMVCGIRRATLGPPGLGRLQS